MLCMRFAASVQEERRCPQAAVRPYTRIGGKCTNLLWSDLGREVPLRLGARALLCEDRLRPWLHFRVL